MRPLKLSGMISPADPLHQIVQAPPGADLVAASDIAPTTVTVTITNPSHQTIGVPQYAPTVVGAGAGYDPAGDCGGSFMSCQFQPNNNCYAYGCDIATNTFPQPGRASGNLITAPTLNGPSVSAFAKADGLQLAGTSLDDLRAFDAKREASGQQGHYVALMISLADGADWPGDYHWARCDDPVNYASWSQKDGNDQVTNFDFAGQPITNPAHANWTVNQGPIGNGNDDDLIVSYDFYCFMFVPSGVVKII